MSRQSTFLNFWLRLSERSMIARTVDPQRLRQKFERKARLFFYGPRGMRSQWESRGGIDALRVTGPWVNCDRVLLYFHGGGYVFGSPDMYKAMLGQLSKRLGVEAILVKYPLSPEHRFPAALTAARAVYDGLLEEGYRPEQIAMGGDSAGGNLALALLAQLLRDEISPPSSLFLFSPLTDLSFSGASFSTNAARDVVLPAEKALDMMEMFLDGQDPSNPLVSPIHADFAGACPVWVTVGSTEILLDDTRRIVKVMQGQGVDVQMHIERDLPHVWPLFHTYLPEARATLDQLAGWIRPRLRLSDGNSQPRPNG